MYTIFPAINTVHAPYLVVLANPYALFTLVSFLLTFPSLNDVLRRNCIRRKGLAPRFAIGLTGSNRIPFFYAGRFAIGLTGTNRIPLFLCRQCSHYLRSCF